LAWLKKKKHGHGNKKSIEFFNGNEIKVFFKVLFSVLELFFLGGPGDGFFHAGHNGVGFEVVILVTRVTLSGK